MTAGRKRVSGEAFQRVPFSEDAQQQQHSRSRTVQRLSRACAMRVSPCVLLAHRYHARRPAAAAPELCGGAGCVPAPAVAVAAATNAPRGTTPAVRFQHVHLCLPGCGPDFARPRTRPSSVPCARATPAAAPPPSKLSQPPAPPTRPTRPTPPTQPTPSKTPGTAQSPRRGSAWSCPKTLTPRPVRSGCTPGGRPTATSSPRTPRRASPSCSPCRRPTSRGGCTWGTPCLRRYRTLWSDTPACPAARRSGCRAPTTRASRRRRARGLGEDGVGPWARAAGGRARRRVGREDSAPRQPLPYPLPTSPTPSIKPLLPQNPPSKPSPP